MGGGFCRNVNTPGTAMNLGRSSLDDLVHRERPLVARLHVGEEEAPGCRPIDERAHVGHVGIARDDLGHWRDGARAMESNEMSCGPRVTPKMKPLSWLGMKPVGMVSNR